MNRLAQETSPYLLQHADNPVDWYPWGQEARSRAREEDKPILLSVGYSACHWCHVMEHESFEDRETAQVMNERFVNVKVDREERPDVDAVYMDAVVALSGHGGWPMTVFLTPEGEPFFGGTYYPPEPRHGLPSFRQLLVAVSDAYRERRDDVTRQAQALVEAVREQNERRPSDEPLTEAVLEEAVGGLRSQFDPEWGGFGRAPKFPPASALEFLLRRGELELVTKTLDAMALGGMYDVVGGGFHRYSVDERWLVPHFEKMLYDNALLVPAYLHGWASTGNERYRTVATQTVGLPGARALDRGRGVRVLAGRRHRRRRGHDLHVGDRRGRAGGAARAVRARTVDPPRRARRGDAPAAARDPRAAAAAGARRQGDHVVERPRARRARRGGPDARAPRPAWRSPRSWPSS